MVETEGFDLPFGAGRLAALERPRRSIHSRSGSNPQLDAKQKDRHKTCLFVLAQRVGFEPTGPIKGLPDFESGPL